MTVVESVLKPVDSICSWSEKHGQIFLGNPVAQQKLIKYSQHHTDAAHTKALADKGYLLDTDWDGIAEFWVHSLEDLTAIFDSDYYKNIVVPDESRFIQREKARFIVGYDDDKWVDGKPGSFIDVGK